MNQISRHQILGKILFAFVIILTIIPSTAYSTTKNTFNESGLEQNKKNEILNFENDSEESINWSNSNFPEIPSKLNRNEDIQMIQNINDSLRRKYMNRSELYENPTLLEEIDNLFTTSFNQETVLYANLSMEDFAINSEYLLDDSETLINSVLKNSSYGIDHGYLFGSLTPQPFNKERKENIQLKLTLPKDIETVRLGSLSNSYYILKRDQALDYTKKEIIREGNLTPSIKIHAELVPASLLQLEINNFNDSMNNLLLEEFNIDYSLVNLEPIGLNAGFVL